MVNSVTQDKLINYHLKDIQNIKKKAFFPYNLPVTTPKDNKEVFDKNLLGYAFFSDTVLIYSVLDSRDGRRNFLHAVFNLLSYPMFNPHYRFRVGISYGEFYHDKKQNIYAGKAIVEATKLESIQEWSGAAFTDNAAQLFSSYFQEESRLIDYDVPTKQIKYQKTRKLKVLNWTLAKHKKQTKYNWMVREENGTIVEKYKSAKIEKKIKNTEKFHREVCVQCK
ncbi:MAG: hypothetical protein ACUZ8N_10350 [Candidatus Scalindua sp.]